MPSEGARGRRRRRRGEPTLLGDVMSAAAPSVGISPEAAALITNADLWRLTVGADLADSGDPVRCADGELVIAARDSVGEARLRYSAEVLRSAVNDRIGREEVLRITVRRP